MKIVNIGKRLVPIEQIAFVDASANPDFRPEKEYKARVILTNKEIVLSETPPQDFASDHGLYFFSEDGVAINPGIRVSVESFEPSEGFSPSKPYQTRLKWVTWPARSRASCS